MRGLCLGTLFVAWGIAIAAAEYRQSATVEGIGLARTPDLKFGPALSTPDVETAPAFDDTARWVLVMKLSLRGAI